MAQTWNRRREEAHVPPSRDLDVQGASNMRDLGGLPVGLDRAVAPGLLLRGDSPRYLTDADVRVFARLGLRTVVDLRSHYEVDQDRRRPLTSLMCCQIRLPMRRSAMGTELDQPPASVPTTLGELYRGYLAHSGPEIASMFSALASPGALPALIHCTAGKDRTGVAVALLLSAIGVDDAHVADDYAQSAGNMDRLVELARAAGDGMVGGAGADPALLEARAGTMADLLAWIRQHHGSVPGLLKGYGVAPVTIDRLRAMVVTERRDGSLPTQQGSSGPPRLGAA